MRQDAAVPASRVTITAFAGLVACALAFTGCSALSPDGDARAERGATLAAEEIAAHTDNTSAISVAEMVEWWVPHSPIYTDSGTATVEPLAWSGHIDTDSTATIDVRVHVVIGASDHNQLFAPSWGPGEATRCFRLVWPRYYPAEVSDLDCPDGPAPPRPGLAPRPELTDADQATVVGILGASADPEEVAAALREAFPQEHVTIETTRFEGETIVAVGIPAERECILAVRDAAGAIGFPSYRQISLEPGEIGCSVGLYTNPPF